MLWWTVPMAPSATIITNVVHCTTTGTSTAAALRRMVPAVRKMPVEILAAHRARRVARAKDVATLTHTVAQTAVAV